MPNKELAIENSSKKELANLIYGLSIRLFCGLQGEAKKQAQKSLNKAKKICDEKGYKYDGYEMLKAKDIINNNTYENLLQAYKSDSKKYEKETVLKVTSQIKVFVEEQEWKGCRLKVYPQLYNFDLFLKGTPQEKDMIFHLIIGSRVDSTESGVDAFDKAIAMQIAGEAFDDLHNKIHITLMPPEGMREY